jgi:hypothetical protein
VARGIAAGPARPQDLSLPMRDFYKRLARYRRDYPRWHSEPLRVECLKLIDSFVQKYQ